jgi:DNA modification methylase
MSDTTASTRATGAVGDAAYGQAEHGLPRAVREGSALHGTRLPIGGGRLCGCKPNHLNCLSAKEWLKSQLGVWQFNYQGRDIRDKKVHPATFPISLATRVIELFTHEGELVVDPFVGSGTTLVAAQDTNRNAVGFDLHGGYIDVSESRLGGAGLFTSTAQVAVHDDASSVAEYLEPGSVSLVLTSPPYANLLNRERRNKSRRNRKNEQLGAVEQYSQDPRDLGTMKLEEYSEAMCDIFAGMRKVLKPGGHCVVNVPDMWWEGQRVTIHISVVEALRKAGYEFRNTIIWDRTNIVNRVGIFGWPSNYITMGTTFEYLLDFVNPPVVGHSGTNGRDETSVNGTQE